MLLIWVLWVGTEIALYGAFLLTIMIAMSDFIDGWVARSTSWGQATTLGSGLDPMTDDFTTIAAFLPLMTMGMIPIWFVLLALLMRFLLASTRLAALLEKQPYPRPRRTTKSATATHYLGIVVLVGLVALVGHPHGEWVACVSTITVTSMALVTGVGIVDFGVANRRILTLYFR